MVADHLQAHRVDLDLVVPVTMMDSVVVLAALEAQVLAGVASAAFLDAPDNSAPGHLVACHACYAVDHQAAYQDVQAEVVHQNEVDVPVDAPVAGLLDVPEVEVLVEMAVALDDSAVDHLDVEDRWEEGRNVVDRGDHPDGLVVDHSSCLVEVHHDAPVAGHLDDQDDPLEERLGVGEDQEDVQDVAGLVDHLDDV